MFLKTVITHLSRRPFSITRINLKKKLPTATASEENLDEIDNDEDYTQFSQRCFGGAHDHNCYIIHPYIKWGSKKVTDTNPQAQLEEATSLIRTLDPWRVHAAIAIPLESFDKKQLFGSGSLEKLLRTVRHPTNNITAVFVNQSRIKQSQHEELERVFKVPVFDRYAIVMQILRRHAVSKHARLQVALAELPYVWAKLRHHDTHFMAASDYDTRRLMLQQRETQLKTAVRRLRAQRDLQRRKRREGDFPVVAVVGYTNAGKTSLIKALTQDANMQPRNRLFATLDVTMHAGVLPCNLEVLFVDTVGFISDIPTNLIECFVATLEDALYADVIIHVEDLASEDHLFQRRHVLETLANLATQTNTTDLQRKMITVGNKVDLCQGDRTGTGFDGITVSSKTKEGLPELVEKLEGLVIENTGRIVMTIRIPIGGEESRWLYKNAAILSTDPDNNNTQLQNTRVVITRAKLEQFKHHFLRKGT